MQLIGLKGKMYAKERFKEKVLMKKTINAHSERDNKHEVEKGPEGAMPAYLLDREQVTHPPMCVGCAKSAERRARCGNCPL